MVKNKIRNYILWGGGVDMISAENIYPWIAEEQMLDVEEEETSVIQDHGHDYLIQTVPAVESEQIISLLPES